MPKTKLGSRLPPHAELAQLISGAAFLRRATMDDLGAAIGRTPKTARSRLRNPGELTVDELVRLGRKLGIPIEQLRDAIRY